MIQQHKVRPKIKTSHHHTKQTIREIREMSLVEVPFCANISLVINEADTTLMRKDVRVSGSWGTDTTELDADDIVGWVRAITFTHSSGNGGDRVIGILHDIHPDPGGTGGVKYREIVRATPVAGAFPPFHRRKLTTVRM